MRCLQLPIPGTDPGASFLVVLTGGSPFLLSHLVGRVRRQGPAADWPFRDCGQEGLVWHHEYAAKFWK
jgi:hypothetical protein